MTLQLRKKHQTTLPSTPAKISLKSLLALSQSALLLLLTADVASAASLQWGQPQAARPTPRKVTKTVEREIPTIKVSRVITAAWEEDDHYAVQPAVAEQRSVVVDAEAPVYDPFDEDDRLAQLPDDPFDEPAGESIPDPNLEDVEEAVEDEIRRRQSADDLFEEEAEEFIESDPFDQDPFDQDIDADPLEEATEQDEELQPGTDDYDVPDLGLDFGSRDDDEEEADAEPTAEELERQRESLAKEQRESQKNCQEELDAIENDRISSIDLSIRVQGDPGKDYPYECAIGTRQHEPRQWPQITYNWKASALCHKPLYFEQVQLERYGHSWGPYVQPIMSGAHFFGTLPVLPYKMGIRTPCECVYTLGYYRPGSCAPYMIDPIPFTWRAALFQTGAATGISLLTP